MYGTDQCSGPIVPAPYAPWQRPVQSPLVQNIVGADTVDLGVDTTYLKQTVAQTSGTPYAVVLPNGNFQRQYHQICVPGDTAPNSASFRVSGTFVGGTALVFNSVATTALLSWDGAAWQLIGGNAQLGS